MVHDTYDIGAYRIGVRWSEPTLAGHLRTALAAHLTDGLSPANFSVVEGGSAGRVQAKHQLHCAHGYTVTSASPGRVLSALIRHLDEIARWGHEGDLLRLYADVIVHDDSPDEAVLVDQRLRYWFDREWPRIRRAGWRAVDLPAADVDVRAGDVVIPTPVLALATSLDELARLGPTDRSVLACPPARLRLRRVVVAVTDPQFDHPVAHGVPMAVLPPDWGITTAVARRTVALLDSVPTRAVNRLTGPLIDALE